MILIMGTLKKGTSNFRKPLNPANPKQSLKTAGELPVVEEILQRPQDPEIAPKCLRRTPLQGGEGFRGRIWGLGLGFSLGVGIWS